MRRLLEICVEDAAGIDAAVSGGADRIELCAALSLGGLTPPASLIRLAAQAPVPVHLLARPREGDFHYTPAEAALVAEDIGTAAEAGLAGVVIGANRPGHGLDTDLLTRWIAHARLLGQARGRPLSLTLHRAFDLTPDPRAALEIAIGLGFARILTSGGKPRAVDAAAMLAALVSAAGERITILAGSGVDPTTLPRLLDTGVREVHASCRRPLGLAGERERAFGFQAAPRRATDRATVAALRTILDGRN